MATQKKTKWEKSSPELVALFDQLVPNDPFVNDPFVEKKKMFGYLCFFANNYLCAGLFQQSMIFRLSEKDMVAFMKTKGATEFAPMKGRVMKSYGAIGDPLEQDKKVLKKWIAKALDYTFSLPPKTQKSVVRVKKTQGRLRTV